MDRTVGWVCERGGRGQASSEVGYFFTMLIVFLFDQSRREGVTGTELVAESGRCLRSDGVVIRRHIRLGLALLATRGGCVYVTAMLPAVGRPFVVVGSGPDREHARRAGLAFEGVPFACGSVCLVVSGVLLSLGEGV
jgi:hypothetical protein